ncbi:MAG: alpha/beta hydrolase domain-containing protein [bacterium]|nr:alpha/beta hydrolase domain-containing protein [bacterium]
MFRFRSDSTIALLVPILLGLGVAFALPAIADPTAPVTVTRPPTEQGEAFVPGTRLVADLPQAYVEEEFFVEGAADLFNYQNDPPSGPTDLVEIAADLPYKTRLIVRRPADPHKFNGTVVVEWWNSTAGFDTAPVYDPSAEYFAREGIIYVGVTNSNQALDYLLGGCRLLGILPPSCGSRYSTLSLPDDGLAYEMMSQIANVLRNGGEAGPIPSAYRVKRVFQAGESQQAGSVITYASAFHEPGVTDGYFVQAGIRARRINGGPICGEDESPAFPDCTPRLAFPDTNVRTDLPVPVYQLITQTDFETLGFNVFGRQSDTPTYRYYEVAGGAHNTVHIDIEVIPAGVFGPAPVQLADLCANEINTTADGPVFVNNVLNALWERMERQARFGWPAPRGRVMDDQDGALVRDALGNVTGGVRLPSMEAPLATYGSMNFADPALPPPLDQFGALACFLSGSVFPFSEAQLEELYPRRFSYFGKVFWSTFSLRRQGLLLREDAFDILNAAFNADVGGGASH